MALAGFIAGFSFIVTAALAMLTVMALVWLSSSAEDAGKNLGRSYEQIFLYRLILLGVCVLGTATAMGVFVSTVVFDRT